MSKREKAEKLPRPPTSVEVKCRVVLKQLGEMFIDDVIRANRFIPRDHRKVGVSLGRLLADSIERLRVLQKEEGSPQLDHDPQLEQRDKIRDAKGRIIEYDPPANDPRFLFYRWDHGIKTNVRGDHGQYSDVVIRKRARRRRKKPYVSPLGIKAASEKAAKVRGRKRKPRFTSSTDKSKPKMKWAAGRKIQSKNNLRRKKR